MHKCPDCGKDTNGSWSEGGAKWALCESCMDRIQSPPPAQRDAASLVSQPWTRGSSDSRPRLASRGLRIEKAKSPPEGDANEG